MNSRLARPPPAGGLRPTLGPSPRASPIYGGVLPTIRPLPTIGRLPSIGHLPTIRPLPTIGRLPSIGHLPTIGRLPSIGHLPTIGHLPAIGHLPTIGRLPAIGHLPSIGPRPLRRAASLGAQAVSERLVEALCYIAATMLGYDLLASGSHRVLILNDWLDSTATWSAARPYLDQESFSWAFADLRGYGRSRGQKGLFSVEEATGDVIELADALGWGTFAIVGHSMSTLVALHLAQNYPDRVPHTILLTPPPPTGFGVDDATLAAIKALALGEDDRRRNYLRMVAGTRLSAGWLRFKLDRWRAAVDPEAAAAYVSMFARRGLPDPTARVAAPVLAVTGELDAEIMRRAVVMESLAPICEQLSVVALSECGHYPMQEAPPHLVAIIERFLAGTPASG
jgi:pimeloyl-ACP methyl ester carboxylesterase